MPGRKASEAERREQILRAAYEIASRGGIERLTVRAVAARAQLSHGLVLFHFKRKSQLVLALLDWVLATSPSSHAAATIEQIPRALDRLRLLLRLEMERLSREPRRIRLLFEYWALGARAPAIGARMRADMDRYREGFQPIIDEVLSTEPSRFAGVTSDGLAAVAVSFINGCAAQALLDPRHFEIEDYLRAVDALVGRHSLHESVRARKGARLRLSSRRRTG
jgi:TetR/AcrR family transcriptional regulator, transcriptional repressor of bet genes